MLDLPYPKASSRCRHSRQYFHEKVIQRIRTGSVERTVDTGTSFFRGMSFGGLFWITFSLVPGAKHLHCTCVSKLSEEKC